MPGARHRSRQRALQVLFQWDLTKKPIEKAIESWYDTAEGDEGERPERDPFMEELAIGATEMAGQIDQQIAAKAQNWTLDRMAVVDRNILRLAVYEMTKRMSPPAVVIDEALELARRFSGDESVPFINGVLDAVNKEQRGPAETDAAGEGV